GLARLIDWLVNTELAGGVRFLPDAERAAFLDYYKSFPKPGDQDAIDRYVRGLWRLDTGWVARWIAQHATTPRILDAGCGFGTFAMMFAAGRAEGLGAA